MRRFAGDWLIASRLDSKKCQGMSLTSRLWLDRLGRMAHLLACDIFEFRVLSHAVAGRYVR
jgi:hypothetical protein